MDKIVTDKLTYLLLDFKIKIFEVHQADVDVPDLRKALAARRSSTEESRNSSTQRYGELFADQRTLLESQTSPAITYHPS